MQLHAGKSARLSPQVDPDWYILRYRPGSEMKAAAILSRRDIPFRIPREHREVRQRGRKREEVRIKSFPLAPGYMFARFYAPWEISDLLFDVARTQSRVITGYLSLDRTPRPVPASELETLFSRDGYVHRLPTGRVRVNEIVPVLGELAAAKVTAVDATTVSALMVWFGSQREVTISKSHIAQLHPGS